MSSPQYVLHRIVEQELADSGSPASTSDFFENFVSEQILKDYDLSSDAIDSGLVDGGNDGGIDSIYVFVNGMLTGDDTSVEDIRRNVTITLYVIQAKYRDGFEQSAVDQLVITFRDLLPPDTNLDSLSSSYNRDLLGAMSRFHQVFEALVTTHPAIEIKCYFATKGTEIHLNVRRRTDHVRAVVNGIFPEANFQFQFLTAHDLVKTYHTQPSTTLRLAIQQGPISAPNKDFVCLVRLVEYFAFIVDDHEDLKHHLFESNVRDYQGKREVNTAIQESLKSSEALEDFWWLNNGITITASDTSLSSNVLTITDSQIVNGLQTSRVLYEYVRDLSAQGRQEESRGVLVRVLVPKDEASRDRIITATNSQTKIPVASLRATDPLQRDIEFDFEARGLYYDRRRGSQKNLGRPRSKIVSIEYLAQATIAVLLQEPDNARARPSNSLKDDSEYERVFDPGAPVEAYFVCARLMRSIDAFMKSQPASYAVADTNNVKWHLGMFVAATTLRKLPMTPTSLARLDLDSIAADMLAKCLTHVWQCYQSEAQRLNSPDRAAKSRELVDLLRNEIRQINAGQLALGQFGRAND